MRMFAKIFNLETGQVLVRLERDNDDNFSLLVTTWSEDDDAPIHARIKPEVTNGDHNDIVYDMFLAFSAEQAQHVVSFFQKDE